MDRVCGVYIMASQSNNVVYTGASTMLLERIQSHKDGLVSGFTKKYECTKLVYFEITDNQDAAYVREKQIKGWTRRKKVILIGDKTQLGKIYLQSLSVWLLAADPSTASQDGVIKNE